MRILVPTLLVLILSGANDLHGHGHGATAGASDLHTEDQVYLEKTVAIRVLPDGRRSIRVKTARKLFADYAVRRLSDPRIRHDKAAVNLVIHAHHVLTPDGQRLDAPEYALNESQADGVGRTVDFASVVETVATHVGAQRGAVLVLDYEITDREPLDPPALDLDLPLGEHARILRLDVSVSVPASLPFHAAIAPADDRIRRLDPELLASDTIHRWTATDLPAWRHEPGGSYQTPHLVVSTWESWGAAIGSLETRVRAAWSARLDCDLSSEIRESAGGPGFPRAWTAIRQGLRPISRLGLRRGLAPRPACRAWDTGYATPMEAALVLASISESSEHATVILSTGDRALVSEVPGLAQLREIRVGLRVPGATKALIIDPLRGTVRGTPSRIEGTGAVEFRLSSPASEAPAVLATVKARSLDDPCRSINEERNYTVNAAGGLRLSLRLSLTRRPDVWLRLANAKDLKKAVATAVTPLLPGGELVQLSMGQLSGDEVRLDAVIESDLGPGPSARIPLGLAFPPPEHLARHLSSVERTTPAVLRFCTRATQKLEFKGLRALGLPGPRQDDAPEGPADRLPTYRVESEPGGLLRALHATEALIAPAVVPRVRAVLGAWLQDEGRTFLLLPSESRFP